MVNNVARAHSGDSESVPRSMSDALKREDGKEWQAAAEVEINAHLENGTWIPSPLPPGKKAIPCRWVFAKKYNADGSLEAALSPGREHSSTLTTDIQETKAAEHQDVYRSPLMPASIH